MRVTTVKGNSRQLITNILSLFLLQGANYVIPLISVPFLFKKLDVDKFGLVNFSFSFIQYFVILTDFGYNLSATKAIAEDRENKPRVQQIFNSVMTSKLALLLFGFLIILALSLTVAKFQEHTLLYIITYGFVVGNALFPVWFFQGMEKMKIITGLSIGLRVASVLPLFFLVKTSADYLWVPILNSSASIVCGFVSLYLVYRHFQVRLRLTGVREVRTSIKESAPFFLSRVSVSLYTTSNVIALGLFAGVRAVGFYSAAEKLFQALQNVYSPLNGSIYPYMAKHKDVKLFKRIFTPAVLFNILLVSGLIFFSQEIILLLYKKGTAETIHVFQILMVACLVIVPSVMLGYPFLAAMGHAGYTNKTVIAPSLFHLVGLLFLNAINQLNIYTVASMVIITESLVLLLRVKGVVKYKLFKPLVPAL